MKYTPELLEILKILTPLVFGIILGYLGYRYQINNGRVNIKRERLLENIVKIEQIVSIIRDTEYSVYRVHEVISKSDGISKRNKELLELIYKDGEKAAHRINADHLKIDEIKSDKPNNPSKVENDLLEYRDNAIMETDKILNHLSECQAELGKNIKILEKNNIELEAFEEKQNNLTKNLYQLDVDAVSQIIDPSGKLLSMLRELISMLYSSESTYDQQIDLHIKIKNLLDKKINKS